MKFEIVLIILNYLCIWTNGNSVEIFENSYKFNKNIFNLASHFPIDPPAPVDCQRKENVIF